MLMGNKTQITKHFYPRSPRGERRQHRRTGSKVRRISIHAPREGSDAKKNASRWTGFFISIHAPREGSDKVCKIDSYLVHISIHAPREGSDGFVQLVKAGGDHFYPRSPRGERPDFAAAKTYISNFYPRSPRGERPSPTPPPARPPRFLSTLPARGATPGPAHQKGGEGAGFLSTLPARGATYRMMFSLAVATFLSTLPARGATGRRRGPHPGGRYFYPRSPRGERRQASIRSGLKELISIHAPREGSDAFSLYLLYNRGEFLSTLPARGATYDYPHLEKRNVVFLSTLPARGATRPSLRSKSRPWSFLSTLPARGATYLQYVLLLDQAISIHAPREGSDSGSRRYSGRSSGISIHAPREGSDASRTPAFS